MPEKPDKEMRRLRRRLEKRRGAIAEPLRVGETPAPAPEESDLDLPQPAGALGEERSRADHEPAEENHGTVANDPVLPQSERDSAQQTERPEVAEWKRPSLSSEYGRERPEARHISQDEGMPAPGSHVSRLRAQRWTGEPVLLALLAVGLVILAVDTYLTLRLNGFSDRLNAMASRPVAAPVASVDRPWVGPHNTTTVTVPNGGQPVTTMHILNSGRAPALDLRSNTVGSLRSATTQPPEVPNQKGPLATTGILFPNMGGNLTFFANTRALTAQEAANVRSGTYVLWLAGRLDYKDSKGHPHVTTFRYRYSPQLATFVAAPDGNSAS